MILSFIISFLIGLSCKRKIEIKYLFFVFFAVFLLSGFFLIYPDFPFPLCYPLSFSWDYQRAQTIPEAGPLDEWVSLRFLGYEVWGDVAHDGHPLAARSWMLAFLQIFVVNILTGTIGFIAGFKLSTWSLVKGIKYKAPSVQPSAFLSFDYQNTELKKGLEKLIPFRSTGFL